MSSHPMRRMCLVAAVALLCVAVAAPASGRRVHSSLTQLQPTHIMEDGPRLLVEADAVGEEPTPQVAESSLAKAARFMAQALFGSAGRALPLSPAHRFVPFTVEHSGALYDRTTPTHLHQFYLGKAGDNDGVDRLISFVTPVFTLHAHNDGSPHVMGQYKLAEGDAPWVDVHSNIVSQRINIAHPEITAGPRIKAIDIMGAYTYEAHLHFVPFAGLKANKQYKYRVSSNKGVTWSEEHYFNTNTINPKFAVYGDWGYQWPTSLQSLARDVSSGAIDGIVHWGDLAYDLYSRGGALGDLYQRQAEPITASVPYMVGPGNHENDKGNYEHYKNRYAGAGKGAGAASGSGSALYYSWNVGLIHFVSLNTECTTVFDQATMCPPLEPVPIRGETPQALQKRREDLNKDRRCLDKIKVQWDNTDNGGRCKQQYDWLNADLNVANRRANREKQPWIVVVGHKSTFDNTGKIDPFTDLMHKWGVDLYLAGHQHNYCRTVPNRGSHVAVYKPGTTFEPVSQTLNRAQLREQKVDTASLRTAGGLPTTTLAEAVIYKNPQYLAEIVVGSFGTKDMDTDLCPATTTAKHLFSHGYGTLAAVNANELKFEYKATGQCVQPTRVPPNCVLDSDAHPQPVSCVGAANTFRDGQGNPRPELVGAKFCRYSAEHAPVLDTLTIQQANHGPRVVPVGQESVTSFHQWKDIP